MLQYVQRYELDAVLLVALLIHLIAVDLLWYVQHYELDAAVRPALRAGCCIALA